MDYSTQGNNKRRKKSKQRAKKSRNKVGVIIFRVCLSLGIIACFAMAGLVFGAYVGIIENADDLSDFTSRVQPTNYASIVYDRNGKEIDRFTGEENREYVSLKNIPDNMKNAIIAIEDERFYSHNGVDLKSMARAVYSTLTGTKQGASTITQQLIKNNVTKKMVNDVESKLQEQYLAVKFEEMLIDQLGTKKDAKDYILETYLNSIGMHHGIYGVQAAAHYYFAGKDVSDLTLSECAVIASITNRPVAYTPALQPENNSVRATHVLNKMLELEFITAQEHRTAMEDISLDNENNVYGRITQYKPTSGTDSSVHDYYSDALVDQLVTDLVEQGIALDRQQASNLIYNGGLKIYTPKDEQIQGIMDEVFMDDAYFPQYDFEIDVTYILSVKNSVTNETFNYEETKIVKTEDEIEGFVNSVKDKYLTANMDFLADRTVANPQPQAAMVIIDHHTGHVMGIVGGRGEKNTNRGFNRATQSARHPGSVFKVLASYAPAIDLGRIGAGSILYDEPYRNEQYNYEPKNWTGSFAGPVTVRQGIYNSMNVVTVKNMIDTGVAECYAYLKQFGFTTLIDSEVRNGITYTDMVPSAALGGLTDGVTQLEVTAAYGTIANGGVYQKPMFYTQVIDHNNNVILESIPERDSRVVLKNTSAYLLTDMMKDVLTRGTGGKAAFREVRMAVAGKTGTSTNTTDLTFVGYTPYYVSGIWLGHDKDKYITEDAGHHMVIWRTIMERIHADLEYKDFDKPNGIVSATLCADSGLLAVSDLCTNDIRGSRTRSDIFAAGVAPSTYCDKHTSVVIDSATGFRATAATPAERMRTIIGVIVADDEVSGNDWEIPASLAAGSTTVRLNHNYAGMDVPEEEGHYEIDPLTGELIFVTTPTDDDGSSTQGDGNMDGQTDGDSQEPKLPSFPGFSSPFFTPRPTEDNDNTTPAAGSTNPTPTPQESLAPIFATPEPTPTPYFPDVPAYGTEPPQATPTPDDNTYVPIISSDDSMPSRDTPPIVD